MWIANVPHGHSAFNSDKQYQVFRNVKDFGCKGDGVSDDTECINLAISSGNRCGGPKCGSSTVTPALVYFPSGKYLISKPIIMYYYTQLVGNALNPPTLIAASNFQGMAMIDTDPYLNDGSEGQWYVNQNNFFRQVRNFIIDLTQTPASSSTTGVHWQVAQATSLMNLHFKMSTDAAAKHQGVWMENGSGGFMSDLTFDGGKYGMWVGNQQFLTRNLTFNGCQTAIFVNWNWQWTFKDINVNNCQIGIDMSSAGVNSSSQIGSVILMDSTISNTKTGIKTFGNLPSSNDTSGSLLLDNVKANGVAALVTDKQGTAILTSNSVQQWGIGSHYTDTSGKPQYSRGDISTKPTKPQVLLGSNGSYFTRSRPQYETLDAKSFAPVTSFGAKGDGQTDDTQAIQKALNQSAGCKIVYFPAGTYIISNTVHVPAGSRLTGEAWSILMAKGQAFQDETKPTPMIQVGNPGDSGMVEFSDIIFSSMNNQKGAVLVEWNMAQSEQGNSGMWDTHFRVGGSIGSNLQYAQCAKPGGSNTTSRYLHQILHLGKGDRGHYQRQGDAHRKDASLEDILVEERETNLHQLKYYVDGEDHMPPLAQPAAAARDASSPHHMDKRQESQPSQTPDYSQCYGVHTLMRMTSSASAYLENVWAWTADHDLDDSELQRKITVYTGRGILIDNTKGPIWLYGVQSEHSVLYQYQLDGTQNVMMAMIQSETPYFQPNPAAPKPLTANTNAPWQDPTYSDCQVTSTNSCNMAWALRSSNSSNIYVYGAGLYSFFNNYDQACLDPENCQQSLVELSPNKNLFLYNINTKGTVQMIVGSGSNGNNTAWAKAADNRNGFCQTINAFLGQASS
ncbi:pectin lyase-like protein [Hesseltinella vesiculosa]|uniref:Pectin lyase-like protein n=1 Tax=Hesseltinella vesiculosa TaxID=101127 RepID=A0A1X2GFW4_9FUNG|nr:pectin lyase-like protein [Hesseltinella vesiculosa]